MPDKQAAWFIGPTQISSSYPSAYLALKDLHAQPPDIIIHHGKKLIKVKKMDISVLPVET